MILYAKWDPKTYTINYKVESGATITPTSFTKTYDKAITEDLAMPIKTGYTFDGWYTDNTFTTTYDKTNDDIYVEDKSSYYIYAKMSANVYNVSFDVGSSGATAPDPVTKTYGQARVEDLPLPTNIPAGYEFLGWYKDNTYNTQWTGKVANDDLTTINGDIVNIYAKWKTAVIFKSNGHGEAPQSKVISGSLTFNLPNMVAIGYTFDGWFENSDFTGIRITNTGPNIALPKVVYAK